MIGIIFHYANRAILQMVGYANLSDLAGKNILDLVHPDDKLLIGFAENLRSLNY